MKNLKLFLGMAAVLLLITIASFACRHNIPPTNNVKFVKMELGGCNNQYDLGETRGDETEQQDTIIFDFQNGTLKVTVGINYICCASMEANYDVTSNKIILQISDTTINQEQYCRCECYYTFDYYFTDLADVQYLFEVNFDSPNNDMDKFFSKYFNANVQ
ncbi:MAG: hypothetical protein LBN95_09755 [Prevotellaceae bacterium]|jgi:hypothetical protein|nr:hypothetical protein [Prevotellaceae bacterium]